MGNKFGRALLLLTTGILLSTQVQAMDRTSEIMSAATTCDDEGIHIGVKAGELIAIVDDLILLVEEIPEADRPQWLQNRYRSSIRRNAMAKESGNLALEYRRNDLCEASVLKFKNSLRLAERSIATFGRTPPQLQAELESLKKK